jgi:TonB family protein
MVAAQKPLPSRDHRERSESFSQRLQAAASRRFSTPQTQSVRATLEWSLTMSEFWKAWEGQIVDGAFHLGQYLSSQENRVVFLTEFGERDAQRAVIKLVLGSPHSTERELRRWVLASKLSHPHLLRIFRTGRCQINDTSCIYAVMEYAEENLAQVVPARPLSPMEAHEMLEPALSALAYIHGQGFVHGHLKPSNILGVDGSLRISSDGLCPIEEPDSVIPDAYSAPEVATQGVSPAADVWSLGATLVEALSQRMPAWGGAQRQELILPETIPAPFDEIARQALRSDPKGRPTVGVIAKLLRKAPVATAEQPAAVAPVASRKWIYASTAVLLLILVVLLVPKLRDSGLVAKEQTAATPTNPPPVDEKPQPVPAPVPAVPTPVVVTPTPTPRPPKEEKRVPVETPPAPAPAPETKESDSSSASPGVVRQVLPKIPPGARNSIQGKVALSVRAQVDVQGNVTSVELDSPGPSKYFADLALKAVRQWKFVPKKSEWIIRFQFRRAETNVVPERVAQ